jgi:hypothetical protein
LEEKMTDERVTTVIDYEIARCPRCNKAHPFKLRGLAERKAGAVVPLFGGTGDGLRKSEVLFTCPETKEKFSQTVPNPADAEIVGLASEEDIAAAARAAAAPPTSAKGEFEEWVKKSRDAAVDFCKLMLSASTGGIPIYFAVLKYAGFEKIGGTALSKFAVLPPVLLLSAAILYVLALRPRFESVLPDDFGAFRRRRLEQLNRFIIAGATVFAVALGLAIVMLFYTLSV